MTPDFRPALPERYVRITEVRAMQGFTAQFVAGFREQTATRFLERHSQVPGLRYTRSTRQDQDWFVVFYGEFEDAAAAREAVAELPGDLRAIGPWIRPLGGF